MSLIAADIQLICGATGAGNSPYVQKLAWVVGPMRCVINGWFKRRHDPDALNSVLGLEETV